MINMATTWTWKVHTVCKYFKINKSVIEVLRSCSRIAAESCFDGIQTMALRSIINWDKNALGLDLLEVMPNN